MIIALTLNVNLSPEGNSSQELAKADPIPLGTTSYHSYDETVTELNQIAVDHPSITKLTSIGKSYEGRDIWAMKVSDNPDIEEDEPEIFYNGNHHAREWLTIDVCLYILNHLTDNYGTDITITGIVDNRQIWVIPCVNPDGRVYDSTEDDPANHRHQPLGWRKNRRDNGDGYYGVDLNRNYGYMWGGAGANDVTSSTLYRGPEAFSENETRAVRDFVRQHDFVFAISYHSYGQLILYPWGYTYNESEDDDLFQAVGDDMAALITNNAASGYPGYTVQQGSDLYMTSGTDDDWLYGEMGIYAFCVELYPHGGDDDAAVSSPYDKFHPREDKVIPVCEDNIEAALYLAQIADNPFQALDYHVSLSTSEDSQKINQTETESFSITVQNDGSHDDIYDLSASSIPEWTIIPNPNVMLLFSELSATTTLSVTVPSGAIGGDYRIWVNATSQSDGTVFDSLIVTVHVPYFNDVGIYSQDTFSESGTYPAGEYLIQSTAKNYGRNSQSEFNVSLEIRKLGAPITKTVYFDNMEDGIKGWQVVDLDGTSSPDSWKQVTSSSNSPTTSWWCGDSTKYSNMTAQLLISPSFSIKEAVGANLSFYHKYKTEGNYDYCSVDVNNGTKWITLKTYDGSGPANFQKVVISLEDHIGNDDVKIRFRFTSDEGVVNNGWYIDDVEITAEFPSETTIYGPEIIRTTGIMVQDDIQQLDWNYIFTEAGEYKVYTTTLLETDEQNINNRSSVRFSMDSSLENYMILKPGWNLISIPLIQDEQDLIQVLESLDGMYDAVQWYDTTDGVDPWKHNKMNKPVGNDLSQITEKIGFWLHVTKSWDTLFLYNGTTQAQNQIITLNPGWNLVGYPSLTDYNRTEGLNNLTFGQDIEVIQWYDAKTDTWHDMAQDDYFVIGRGFWIYSKNEITWEVPL
jgi:hypothetical protein